MCVTKPSPFLFNVRYLFWLVHKKGGACLKQAFYFCLFCIICNVAVMNFSSHSGYIAGC